MKDEPGCWWLRCEEQPRHRCVICRQLFCRTHILPDAHWCKGEPKEQL